MPRLGTFAAFRLLFGAGAVLLGLLAALLNFWSGAQTKTEQSRNQVWFASLLHRVEISSWSSLPSVVITIGLKVIQVCITLPTAVGLVYMPVFVMMVPPFVLALMLVDSAFLNGAAGVTGVYGTLFLALLSACATGVLVMSSRRHVKWTEFLGGKQRISLIEGVPVIILYVCSPYAVICWWKIALKVPLRYALFSAFVLVPILGAWMSLGAFYLSQIVKALWKRRTSSPVSAHVLLLGFSITVSLLVTFIALFVGHIVDPAAWVPQTAQALVSNVIFDALTVAATAWLFSRAADIQSSSRWSASEGSVPQSEVMVMVRQLTSLELFIFRPVSKRLSVPAAVSLDLVLALLFACASLWCSLASTVNALTIHQVLRVLIARSVDGRRWQAGPFFWMMHTTFLPTVVYVLLVLLAWWTKATLGPVRWFLGRAQHQDINPIGLTARLIASMAAMLGLASFAADLLGRL